MGRIEALLRIERRDILIEHVCFYATDVYPNGIKATDFVWERLTKAGFQPEQLTIEAVADTTHGEAEAFARYCGKRTRLGHTIAVTSFYHAFRCAFLLRRSGCSSRVIMSRAFALRDLVLEVPKLALECTPAGRRVKERLRARMPPRAA